ncbi:MAG: response regulator [Nitrospirae bacterium]|nr:response regulator [Nitrospirota bacterium]
MGWYGNMKIRNKLISGYAVVVVIALALGLFSYVQINKMRESDTRLYEKGVLAINLVGDVSSNFQRVRANLRESILENDLKKIEYYEGRVIKFRGIVTKTAKDLEKTLPDVEAKQLFDALMDVHNEYIRHQEKVLELAKQNKDREAFEYLTVTAYENEKEIIEAIEKLSAHLTKIAGETSTADIANAAETGRIMLILALSASLLAAVISILISRSIVNPLRLVLDSVQLQQAGGKEKAQLLEAIANGDLGRDVTITKPLTFEEERFSRDEAGLLLKAIIGMSEVQFSFDQAFARMTESLRKSRHEEQGRDWLKTGLNELNALMRGEQKTEEMADKVLTFLSEYLKAGAGAFYLYDERGAALVLAATYAFTHRKHLGDRFKPGEGLIGQAALEKKTICLSNIPPDYVKIGSALGESVPQNIVALPLLHNGQLVAAMELGTFRPFSDNELDFLSQAMEGIAIGLGVSHSRQRINELLEQTQQQTEELRVQQEELQQTNEELEERAEMLEQQGKQIQIKNREIEAASTELKRKAAELEKTSSYKSEFLANMSHELRTPLNSMMILSSLLIENKEGTLTDRQQEFAATIHSAGKDLLNLINDILDLSKVEAGRLELLYEDVETGAFCRNLEEMFRPQAGQKGLDFSVIVQESTPKKLRIDEQRTEQILKNLLSNAFKFTEKGSVELSIAAPAGANPLSMPAVSFMVRDTGIGIEKDKHDLVFQAFQQADGSTSRKFGGTGLGLSISLQLARRMGGDITLESERGKGSTFTLYLPVSGKAADGPPAPTLLNAPQTGMPAVAAQADSAETAGLLQIMRPLPDDRDRLKKDDKSILIIEDDLNFARTLMTMVRDKGFGCIVAADGTSGIHLVETYLPSAVILDVMLPGMDGWSVMRSLKDNPATRHIPVHFITCLDERLKGMAMGAVGFFTKPVTPAQLEEVFSSIEKSVTKTMRRLLIIEDNAGEAQSMTSLLQDRSLEISVAGTGREAIDILGQRQIDCIVLDIGLPDMSGFDLLEHIHRDEKLRSIPVIIHTGRDLSHEEELKLQHYARSIIIKGAKGPERLLNEVTLFLHMVENDLPREKQKMIRAALDREAMLEGKKVLLVDDDMRNVFSLSSILSDKNMVIIEAENGKEALARIREHQDINIVLMDIMMPEMDGYEAIRAIRLDPRCRNLPIIAMTAKAMAGDQEKCIQAGASDYISKPLDIEKLLSLLRVWLYRQT